MGDYRFVRFTTDQLDDVLMLQRHHWGRDVEANASYFDWKYRRNPYAGEPDLYLAYDASTLVAMQGAYGARWIASDGADPVVAFGKGDMVVHPDHRRRGLSDRLVNEMLTDQRERERGAVIATSTTAVTTPAMRRDGWLPVEQFHLHRRTPGRSRAGLAFLEASVGHLARRVRGGSLTHAPVPAELTVLEQTTKSLDDVLTEFADINSIVEINRASSFHSGWTHVRDHTFYEWRLANPFVNYRFAYFPASSPTAYIVIAIDRVASSVRIADWGGVDEASLQALLRLLTGQLDELAMEIGLARTEPVFRRVGFYQASRKPIHGRAVRLLWYPLSAPADALPTNADDWSWRDLYSDNY